MTPFKIALLALLCMGLARAAEEAENAADTIDIASYLECSSGQFWYSYNYNWTLDASVPVAQQSCVSLGSVESDTDKEPAQLLTNFDASYTTTALYNVYGTLKFKCGVTSVCTTLDGIVLSNNCSSNSYNLASANLNNGFTCNFWGTISNLSKVKENKVTVTFKTSTCTKTATVCLEEKASVELHRCIVVSQDDSGIAHSGLTIVSGPGEDKMYCASKNIASASFPGTFEVNVSVVCSASNYELSADVIGDVDDSDVDLVEGVEWCLSLSCGCEPEPEPEPEPCPHPHPPCFPMIPIFFQPIFPFPGPFPCGPQPHPKPDCDDCDDCDDEVAARKTSCSSKRSSKRCTRSAQPSQALKKRCAK